MTVDDFYNEFVEILEEAKESLPKEEYNTLVFSDLPKLLAEQEESVK